MATGRVRRSHVLWRELEDATGTRLMTETGGLILGHPESPFLRDTRAAAVTYGIAHERIAPDELAARFPMFATDAETEGYYEAEAGYVRPEAAVTAQLELARRSGAELRTNETVRSWTATAHGARVDTDAGTHDAGQLAPFAIPPAAHADPASGSQM